jgi:uncharacterized membrane protein YdjX (TVP38/TMEM64 family)
MFKWLLLALAAIAVFVLYQSGRFDVLLSVDLEGIRELSNGSHFMILLSMLIIMIIQNVFTIIPLILVISVNISLFGFWHGYLWSWFTSILGGLAVFLAARYWLQDVLVNRVNPRWLSQVEKKGPWFVFFGRVIPFIPTSIVNIAAGASVVSMKHFILGTIIGNLLFFLIMSIIAYGFTSAFADQTAYLVLGGGVVLAAYTTYKVVRKRRSRRTGTPEVLQEQQSAAPPMP